MTAREGCELCLFKHFVVPILNGIPLKSHSSIERQAAYSSDMTFQEGRRKWMNNDAWKAFFHHEPAQLSASAKTCLQACCIIKTCADQSNKY